MTASPKKRLFIAIDVSPAEKERLAAAQEILQPAVPDAKWVGAAGLHITLIFLGYVDRPAEAAIKKAVGLVARQTAPFHFTVAGIGGFPTDNRPRVVWAGVADNGACAAVAAELTAVLAPTGYEGEDRPFQPHVTLGRVKNPRRVAQPDAFAAAVEALGAERQLASELVIYRSRLSRAGAEYFAEAAFALAGPAAIDTNTCL